MVQRIDKHGLQVAKELATFVDESALPGTGVAKDDFWSGFSSLIKDMTPKNRAFLERRADLQRQIDDWHKSHRNQPHDHEAYKAFLKDIGYLVAKGKDFEIETTNVDPEIALVPGPQLGWCRSPMRAMPLMPRTPAGEAFMTGFMAPTPWARPLPRAAMIAGAVPVSWPAHACFWTKPFRWWEPATRMCAAITSKTARFDRRLPTGQPRKIRGLSRQSKGPRCHPAT